MKKNIIKKHIPTIANIESVLRAIAPLSRIDRKFTGSRDGIVVTPIIHLGGGSYEEDGEYKEL